MPTWGIIAQLSISVVTAIVAVALYRLQADKLFLDFRDKRALALADYTKAAHARLVVVSSIGVPDIIGLIDPDRLNAGNAERYATAAVLRTWFGHEVGLLITRCEKSLDLAYERKVGWCADPDGKAANYDDVSGAILAAYRAVAELSAAAAPYLDAGRRGLTPLQRIRAATRSVRRGG